MLIFEKTLKKNQTSFGYNSCGHIQYPFAVHVLSVVVGDKIGTFFQFSAQNRLCRQLTIEE